MAAEQHGKQKLSIIELVIVVPVILALLVGWLYMQSPAASLAEYFGYFSLRGIIAAITGLWVVRLYFKTNADEGSRVAFGLALTMFGAALYR